MEELLKALKLIRDTCNQCKFCHECPLYGKEAGCLTQADGPGNWELVEEVPRVRLFKEEA